MAESAQPVVFLAFSRLQQAPYDELVHLGEEADKLQRIFDAAQQRNLCELVFKENVTLKYILDIFQDARYHGRIAVFHFGGHADDYSLLLDSAKHQLISPGVENFAALLGEQPGLKLVFLNACVTHEHVASLHAAGIPNVVTTTAEVPDELCARFAERFYMGLSSCASVYSAFKTAVTELTSEVTNPGVLAWALSTDGADAGSWALGQPQAYGRAAALYLSPGHFQRRLYLETAVKEYLERHNRGYLILCAKAGMGKTTFLSWLAQNPDCAAYFEARSSDNESAAYTAAGQQLAVRWSLEPYPAKVSTVQELTSYIERAADKRNRYSPHDRIIIILDGLEQITLLPGMESSLLPWRLPLGVYLFCGSRPGAALNAIFGGIGESVEYIEFEKDAFCWQENLRDIRSHIRNRLADPDFADLMLAGAISGDTAVETIVGRSEGVWIYVHFLFEELKRLTDAAAEHPVGTGEAEPADLDRFIERLPQGLSAFYTRMFTQIREQAGKEWQAVHLKLLGLLAAMRTPLQLSQFYEIYPHLKRFDVSSLIEQTWLPIIAVDSKGVEQRYRFYHESLRDFLNGRLDATETAAPQAMRSPIGDVLAAATQQAHSDIVDYYLDHWGGWQLSTLDPKAALSDSDIYGLENIFHHLKAAHRYSELFHIARGSTEAELTHENSASAPKHHLLTDFFSRHRRQKSKLSGAAANPWFEVRHQRGELANYVNDLQTVRSAIWDLVHRGEDGRSTQGIWFQQLVSVDIVHASLRVLLSGMPSSFAAALLETKHLDAQYAIALTDSFADVESREEALFKIAESLIAACNLDTALQVAQRLRDPKRRLAVLMGIAQSAEAGSTQHTQTIHWIFYLINTQGGLPSNVSLKQIFCVCSTGMNNELALEASEIVKRRAGKGELPSALGYLMREVVTAGHFDAAMAVVGAIQGENLQDATFMHLAVELAQVADFSEAWKVTGHIRQNRVKRTAIIGSARYASPADLSEELWKIIRELPPAEAAKTAGDLAGALPFAIDQPHLDTLLAQISREPSIRYRVPLLLALLANTGPSLRQNVESVLTQLEDEQGILKPGVRMYDIWARQPLDALSQNLRAKCIEALGESVRTKFARILETTEYGTEYRPQRVSDRILKHALEEEELVLTVPRKVLTILDWLEVLLLHGLVAETLELACALFREYQNDNEVITTVTRKLDRILLTNCEKVAASAQECKRGQSRGELSSFYTFVPDERAKLSLRLVASQALAQEDRAKEISDILQATQFTSTENEFFFVVASTLRVIPKSSWLPMVREIVRCLVTQKEPKKTILGMQTALKGLDDAQEIYEAELLAAINSPKNAIAGDRSFELLLAISEFGHKQAATQAIYAALGMLDSPNPVGIGSIQLGGPNRNAEMPFVRLVEFGDISALHRAPQYLADQELVRFLQGAAEHLDLANDEPNAKYILDLINQRSWRSDRNMLYNLYLQKIPGSIVKQYDPTSERIGDSTAVSWARVMTDFSFLITKPRKDARFFSEVETLLMASDVSLELFHCVVDLAGAVADSIPNAGALTNTLLQVASRKFADTQFMLAAQKIPPHLPLNATSYEIILKTVRSNIEHLSELEGKYLVAKKQYDSDQKVAVGSTRLARDIVEFLTQAMRPIGDHNLQSALNMVSLSYRQLSRSSVQDYQSLYIEIAGRGSPLSSRQVLYELDKFKRKAQGGGDVIDHCWYARIAVAACACLGATDREQVPLTNLARESIHFLTTHAESSLLQIEPWLVNLLFELAITGPSNNVDAAIAAFTNLSHGTVTLLKARCLTALATSRHLSLEWQSELIAQAQILYSNRFEFYSFCLDHLHQFPAPLQEQLCGESLGWLHDSGDAGHVQVLLPKLLPYLAPQSQRADALSLMAAQQISGFPRVAAMVTKLAYAMHRNKVALSESMAVLDLYNSSREDLIAAIAGLSSYISLASQDGEPLIEITTTIRNAVAWWP